MKRFFALIALVAVLGCGVKDKIEDAIDVINVDRKPIDISKTGVNAFGNDSRFGSISQQYSEVKNTLGLRYVRVIFSWSDGVQPTPSSDLNLSFDDDIMAGIPAGVDVLAVVGGLPSWMSNSANWIDGNPRKTFVEKFFKPLMRHFADNSRLTAVQVWNEPNMLANPDNTTLGVHDNPANYVEMLTLASSALRSIAPGKRVLNAATTAINQNYPETLDYNKALVESGMLEAVDIYAAHYYGEQFEKVAVDGGVADFLNGVGIPVWITESGAQGVNNQLAYVEKAWPFLSEKIPSIARFYYYQFTEDSSPETTYGLKNPSSSQPVSDLYTYLRDHS